jgi:hypothetical protein
MDLRATKDRYERETEESDRLVRPAPKVKPPRHDRRRERMDPDRDPDIDTDADIARDKDLSLNRKNVGGSMTERVVARFLRSDLVLTDESKDDKSDDWVQVVNKETGEPTRVKKETLSTPEGKQLYEVKETAPEEKKEKDEAFYSQARAQLEEMAASDPQLKSILDSGLDLKTDFGQLLDGAPHLPVSKILKDKKMPEGIETLGDLQKALKTKPAPSKEKGKKKDKGKKGPATQAPPQEKAKPAVPSKGHDEGPPPPAGDVETPGEGPAPDSQKPPAQPQEEETEFDLKTPEDKKELHSFISEKGYEKPEFQEWAKKQKTVAEDKDGKALFFDRTTEQRVPFDKLDPKEQERVKAQFEAEVKTQRNADSLKDLASQRPEIKKLLRDLANPESELRQQIESEGREQGGLEQFDIKKTIEGLRHVDLPATMSGVQDLLEAADKAFAPPPPPKRSKPSKQEMIRAQDAITETFPPDIAEGLLGQDLHPDDVSALISDYKAALAKGPPTDDAGGIAKALSDHHPYHLDSDAIEVPEKIGKKSFEDLSPEDQAEEFAKYKMRVMAASLAARKQVADALWETGMPAEAARLVSDAMLRAGNKDVPDEAVEHFYRKALETAENERRMTDREIAHLLDTVKDHPAARKMAVAYLQARDYADARAEFLSPSSKTRISEWDDPKKIARQIEKASEFLKERAARYPEDATVQDTAAIFRNRVVDRMKALAPEKTPFIREYMADYEMEDYQEKKASYDKAQRKYESALRREEKEGEGDYRRPSAQTSAEDRLKEKGVFPPRQPSKPPGFDLWKERDEGEKRGRSVWDMFRKLFHGKGKPTVEQKTAARALVPSLRQRVAFRHLFSESYSSYPTRWTMGDLSPDHVRTAVYWGVDPYPKGQEGFEPYKDWTQLQARDFSDADAKAILAGAREWLKQPVLGREIEGLYPDTQYRAALDLAIRDVDGGKYSVGLHPTVYNELLGKLSGQGGPYELLSGTAKDASTKTAGWSYAVEKMSFLFVEGRKIHPFNIDVIHAINQTFVPVKGDDGKMHDDGALKFVNSTYSDRSLTHMEEKQGYRREIRVDIQCPKGAEAAVKKAMADVGKKFGFKVEPTSHDYHPQTRKPAGRQAESKSTYVETPEEVTTMKASAQVRSLAVRAASANAELGYDLLALADKLAAEEAEAAGAAQYAAEQEQEQAKQAAVKVAADNLRKYQELRSQVIRLAAASPEARNALLPILQSFKQG